MAFVPWVRKKMDNVKNKNQRDQNSEEENKLLDLAKERWVTATERKVDFSGESLHSKWKRFDQIYRNKQWFEPVPDEKSTPVINLTLAMIQAVLPRITDSYPEFLILPRRSANHGRLAEMLTAIVRYLWYHNRMQEQKIGESTLHMLKYGTSIIKTVWDPDMWNGLGDVRYSVVHPMNFFPDPRAYQIDEMDYCFTSVPKSVEYFLRRWPEKGKYVIPDNEWGETEALEGRDQPSKEEVASLKEYWFRDENGDLCMMYYTGHLVLDVLGGKLDNYQPDSGPLCRHNRFPFAKYVDYPGDKEFWGFGEIELAEVLQRLINAFEAQIIDNTRLMANAQWVVNKVLSGLKEEDAWIFDNQPGRVIFTHNDGVRKEPGTSIPPHVPDHMERLIFMLEQVLGIHDVVQGRRPVGVRAASAIIALQEAANIRVRQKSKHLGDALRELTEQSISLVLENYDEPRQMRMAGQTIPTTMDVHEVLMSDIVERAGDAEEIQYDEFNNIPEEEMERLQQEIAFPEFDVEIKVGPSLPYSQALLYEQSKEFYQLGIIDRQAVLEATNFPDRERIMERLMQQEQAAAQAQEGERAGERAF